MNRYDTTLPLYGTGPPKKKFGGIGLRDNLRITGTEMFMSLLFWLFLIFCAYKAIDYGLLYRSLNDSELDEPDCCTNFGGTEQDKLNFVEGYNKGDAGPYLSRLGPESYNVAFKGTPSPAELSQIPPIVTAVTSSDFYDLQGLIKQINEEIRPALGDVKFIVYDLGLYASELELIKTHCKCEVSSFQTSAYPDHVADLTTFAWRPIIIQSVLEQHGSVFYVAPSTRFTNAADLKQLKYRGSRFFFLWNEPVFSGTVAYTNPLTYTYLKEKACCYKEAGLVDMSALVFYRTNMTWTAIMKPWLKCALNKDCIAPAKSRYSGCFNMRKPKTTGCHRYDQSALSIIVERVFQLTLHSDKLVIPRMFRERTEYVEYFPEQPWSYMELFFVIAMPLACAGGLYYIYQRQKRRKPAARKR